MGSIKVSTLLASTPQQLYSAWLSSKHHSAFTGGRALINPKIGGTFSAWDGYICGYILELHPYRRILQSWRTTGFPENSKDSILEILFEEVPKGTKITLIHKDIPSGQDELYKKGWLSYYFKPMKAYFKS